MNSLALDAVSRIPWLVYETYVYEKYEDPWLTPEVKLVAAFADMDDAVAFVAQKQKKKNEATEFIICDLNIRWGGMNWMNERKVKISMNLLKNLVWYFIFHNDKPELKQEICQELKNIMAVTSPCDPADERVRRSSE